LALFDSENSLELVTNGRKHIWMLKKIYNVSMAHDPSSTSCIVEESWDSLCSALFYDLLLYPFGQTKPRNFNHIPSNPKIFLYSMPHSIGELPFSFNMLRSSF
ncbi:hypothetical protein ADUPG1_012103, partial [Aduncisulcus paluster]